MQLFPKKLKTAKADIYYVFKESVGSFKITNFIFRPFYF